VQDLVLMHIGHAFSNPQKKKEIRKLPIGFLTVFTQQRLHGQAVIPSLHFENPP